MKEEYRKLIDMVRKGMTDKEIMKELGIKTKAALKKMHYDALVEAGKVKGILSEKEVKKAVSKKKVLTMGKRGTLLLGKALMVDEFGFQEGDRFTVGKRRDSIILRKEKEE